MSNQARLLLLSGTGGSGTTSACTATVAALEDEGLRACRLDPFVSGIDGTDDFDETAAAALAALTGVTHGHPVQWWGSVPVASYLVAWRRIREATQAAGVDAVVVDLGDLRQAIAMIDFPSAALRVIAASVTPDVASRSDADAEDSAFSVLSAASIAMAASATLLESDRTAIRLVAEGRAHSVDRVLRAAAVLAMLGGDVDGIIVNRCARKSNGATATELNEQRDLLAMAERSADGPLVWKSTDRIRPVPKGRSATGSLGRSNVLRDDTLVVEPDEDGFTLHIPLSGVGVAGARVGRYEDSLVVAMDGSTRWLDLPSVLRRCRAVEAQRTDSGLRVEFVPDPSLWREDARTEGAA